MVSTKLNFGSFLKTSPAIGGKLEQNHVKGTVKIRTDVNAWILDELARFTSQSVSCALSFSVSAVTRQLFIL